CSRSRPSTHNRTSSPSLHDALPIWPAAERRHTMRSPVTGIVALFLLFVVLIVAYSSVFTVAQTEQVLVVRLGEPVRVVTEPGLQDRKSTRLNSSYVQTSYAVCCMKK